MGAKLVDVKVDNPLVGPRSFILCLGLIGLICVPFHTWRQQYLVRERIARGERVNPMRARIDCFVLRVGRFRRRLIFVFLGRDDGTTQPSLCFIVTFHSPFLFFWHCASPLWRVSSQRTQVHEIHVCPEILESPGTSVTAQVCDGCLGKSVTITIQHYFANVK